MHLPIAPLDVDLARDAAPLPVPDRFRRARVLARWSGVPIGIVEVSVCQGAVRVQDVARAVQRLFPYALPREAVRRALHRTGLAGRLDPASVWTADTSPSDAPAPTITLAICTRDRAPDLASCLAAVARLDPKPLEVLVVDNAPATDATRRLLRDSYPFVRYACEPRAGLDHARNHALTLAGGEVIAFTDDDAVVDPDWIGALGRAFAADPAIGLVTGLAEPLELESRAQLLFERYGGFGRGCRRVYCQTAADAPMPWTLVGAGQLGAGVNMAIRRTVLDRVGLFDPALDVGTPTLGGGDHDYFFRVLRAGFLCVYEPAAVVRHRHRRTMQELQRLLYSYGHGTRCFLEREAMNFAADGPAIRRLQRWWWSQWAWRRWRQSAFRPAALPAGLVFEEIKGYWRGRGAYAKARARILPDESNRPDDPRPSPVAAVRPLAAVGIAVVEVSEPLRPLEQSAEFGAMDIMVQWRGRPLGTVRIASFGQSISARWLADEIAHALWHRLLDPEEPDVSRAFARFDAAFAALLPIAATTGERGIAGSASVIVTTCNRPDSLRRCLQSLAQLQSRRAVQIIVVDNRPALGAAAPVVREFPGVELVLEPRPGSSYARNAGAAAARGDFVAMVDDDMVVGPEWLDRLLAPFARADVLAVTGNTRPARLETPAERMLELYGGFGRGFESRDFDRVWFQQWRRRAVPTWQIGGSGNLAGRRELFARYRFGRFVETLGAGVPTGVGEDTRLFYDILHAGFTVVYEPAAVAWHYHRATMKELRRQLYAYSRGHVAYHLTTWFAYRDGRALVRIFAELPLAFVARAWDRLRGRSHYAWHLLFLEMAGTLAGPWSLWCAHRSARCLARTAPANQLVRRPARAMFVATERPASEVQS